MNRASGSAVGSVSVGASASGAVFRVDIVGWCGCSECGTGRLSSPEVYRMRHYDHVWTYP